MLPTGTVTFLLTDIEGSTRLWQTHPDVMGGVVERHYELTARLVSAHDGVFVKSKGEGDSTFSVFARPSDAVASAVAVRDALAAEPWPGAVELKVRAAIHTGEAELRDGDYFGQAVNRCARIRAVAHGGQIVCSQATADLVADGLDGVVLRSLGTHRLKDLERPEQIHQVGEGDFPPLRSLDAFRHNLPTQRTSFVGRREQLDHVRKLLSNDRLVTLTGIGGSGKTRLALQVAAEELDVFEDGVFFCELAQISEPADVTVQLARAIGFPLGGPMDSRTLRDDLFATLAPQHSLLILDNCEHLIETCAELADEVLERCPQVHLLVTTREALEVEGERTFSVPSLAVPPEGEVAEVESVRLFVDRAAAVIDGFMLTPDNAGAIAEICRRLDGIPLAIELAAGQVATLTPLQITERLADRFMLLTGGRRRVQRQHTLAAALDWSYDLLSDAEQTFLRSLSVFPGTFTLEHSEAICASGLPQPGVHLLRALVSKSLVETTEGDRGRRYRLLETVRLYAEEKLLGSGEADGLRSAHRDHFVGWAAGMGGVEEAGFDPDRFNVVLGEAASLRAALAWASREGRTDQVALLAGFSMPLWMQGSLDEGERWIEEGLSCGDLEPRQRFELLVAGGLVAIMRMDLPAWDARATEAVALSAHSTSDLFVATAHAQLAQFRALEVFLFQMDDRRDQARSLAATAERHLAAVGADIHENPRGVVRVSLGMAYAALGDLDDAVRVLDVEAPPGTGALRRGTLSTIRSIRGDYPAALDEGRAVIRLLEEEVWLPPIFEVLGRLPTGLALAGTGDHDAALRFMRETLGASPDHLERGGTSTVVTLAAMAELRGDHEIAAQLIGAANVAMEAFRFRSPLDFILRDHHLARIRQALSPERVDELVAEGRGLSLREAIDLGLRDG